MGIVTSSSVRRPTNRALVLVLACWLCAGDGGCGRVRFDDHGDGGVVDDAGSSAGLDADFDAALADTAMAGCRAHPALGASGCLEGDAPIALWDFAGDVQGGIAYDSAGRTTCTPLTFIAGATVDGAGNVDLTDGQLIADPTTDVTQLAGALVTAQAGSVAVWIRTSTTPTTGTTPIVTLLDQATDRVTIGQSPTGTTGRIAGATISIGASIRNVASGEDVLMIMRTDGSGPNFYVAGHATGYASTLNWAWQPATTTLRFGPWTGSIRQAAVYDRNLTTAEASCLAIAGATVVP